jgi:hypothetical protein
MGTFDWVKCDMPLPDLGLVDSLFQTKDFDRIFDEYRITHDGRLMVEDYDLEQEGEDVIKLDNGKSLRIPKFRRVNRKEYEYRTKYGELMDGSLEFHDFERAYLAFFEDGVCKKIEEYERFPRR